MIRIIGFFLGAATSIGVILLITGLPEFHLQDPAINQQRYDAAVEKLMARKREAAQALADNVRETAESLGDNFASADSEVLDRTKTTEPAAPQVQADEGDDIAPIAMSFRFAPPVDDAQTLADMQWYSFWNPFRSKIAASGFVSRLEKVTGLDYRIVKVKTGVYEVAFAYNDDDERRSKLSQISAATGLDLPDS